jgi:predicted phage terminase large subunit-like protein
MMTVKEADSDLERQSILRAFSEGLPTRLNNPMTAARILVGQRVSEDDPTNLALETWTDAVHLMFPARFEVNRCCPQDRRTYEGELLWPEVWPETELRKVELGLSALEKGQNVLSSFAAQAQLQQAPVPRGGGCIPREAWRIWPLKTPEPADIQRTRTGEYLVQLPEVQHVIVSVDTAFSERETADFSGVVALGVWSLRREEVSRAAPWMADRWGGGEPDPAEEASRMAAGEVPEQPRVILMEAFATRAQLNDQTLDERTKKPRGLVQRLADLCKRRQAHRVVIENANRGKDTATELRRELHGYDIDVELITPSASKLARMNSVQPLFAQGLVFSPANLVRTVDRYGREQVDVREFQWVEEVVRQANRTPRGKQDLADALSMGLSVLRRDGWLELTIEHIRSQLEAKAWRPKPGSIGRDIARSYGVV